MIEGAEGRRVVGWYIAGADIGRQNALILGQWGGRALGFLASDFAKYCCKVTVLSWLSIQGGSLSQEFFGENGSCHKNNFLSYECGKGLAVAVLTGWGVRVVKRHVSEQANQYTQLIVGKVGSVAGGVIGVTLALAVNLFECAIRMAKYAISAAEYVVDGAKYAVEAAEHAINVTEYTHNRVR